MGSECSHDGFAVIAESTIELATRQEATNFQTERFPGGDEDLPVWGEGQVSDAWFFHAKRHMEDTLTSFAEIRVERSIFVQARDGRQFAFGPAVAGGSAGQDVPIGLDRKRVDTPNVGRGASIRAERSIDLPVWQQPRDPRVPIKRPGEKDSSLRIDGNFVTPLTRSTAEALKPFDYPAFSEARFKGSIGAQLGESGIHFFVFGKLHNEEDPRSGKRNRMLRTKHR